jgi:hypothetical protein
VKENDIGGHLGIYTAFLTEILEEGDHLEDVLSHDGVNTYITRNYK